MDNVDRPSNTSVQFQLASQSAIKRGNDSILTQCRLISDIVHHCTDLDVLRQLYVALGNSLKFLTESVPKDGSFILEGDMLHIGTTKVADKVKTKYQRKRTLLRKTELPEIYLEYTLWKLTHTKVTISMQYLYTNLIVYLKLFTSLKHFDVMMNVTLIIISSIFLQHILKLGYIQPYR